MMMHDFHSLEPDQSYATIDQNFLQKTLKRPHFCKYHELAVYIHAITPFFFTIHLSLSLLPLLQATGNTSLVPWLTSYFYIYYPALILLVCIATLLSCGTRLASVFGYQKFIGEDDFSADYIDEGKVLMKRGGRGVWVWFRFQFQFVVERRLRERSLREEGNTGVRSYYSWNAV